MKQVLYNCINMKIELCTLTRVHLLLRKVFFLISFKTATLSFHSFCHQLFNGFSSFFEKINYQGFLWLLPAKN